MYKKLFIKKCSLFSDLSDRELTKIENIALIKRVDKGKVVIREGARANGFFIVSSGRVKIYKISPEGRERTMFIAEKTDMFAEVAMFSGDSYPAYADALSRCELLFIPKSEFIELLKESPELSIKMLGSLSKIIRRFNSMIEDLSLKEVPSRFAKYLLDLSVKHKSDSFELDVKKSDIALRLGTASETLSRTIKKFREKKIISITSKQIKILKKELLRKIASGFKI